MKKKLLFVMESLGIGGAEKSLVTLLSQLDYSKYEVDLFLFRKEGEFIELLPKEVNILETPREFEVFMLSPQNSIKGILEIKNVRLLILKIMQIICLTFTRYILKKEYIGWNFNSRSIKKIEKEYDVAIGFLEKHSIYFTVDKVKSTKKIGWIHIDYEKIQHNYRLDKKYFEKLNNIVTVSNHCKEVLVERFPKYKDKIKVIQNIISPKFINSMANENNKELSKFDSKDIIICTVCRLTEQKGVDIAIECCEKLYKKGLKFKWIVIGDGSERLTLESKINSNNLNNIFILIGSKSNPYPYIKRCNIYVQPSRWEGFGITVAEAKVLRKPIVVNNIPEFIEQIEDDSTGLIYSDMESMINKIETLIIKKEERNRLVNNLSCINMNNSGELKKIEYLFN